MSARREATCSLLVEDRVENVGVVDVVEHHRLLLRGDATGKAVADGDADALLDLLLDSECGAGDELVRVVVEQEDRARVDVEQLPRADEQRVEERIELEMRERGVRDRLQPPDVFDRRNPGHHPVGLPVTPPV